MQKDEWDKQRIREGQRDKDTGRLCRCDRSGSLGHTHIDTQAHWLWQRPCPVPASCAKTRASLAKRGSHKKTPLPSPLALWPSPISILPHSPVFWLLHISCSLELCLSITSLTICLSSLPVTNISLSSYTWSSSLHYSVPTSLSHSLLSSFIPTLPFSTLGLDRAIITLPPIYSQPVIFHLVWGDLGPNPCPEYLILATGFIPEWLGECGPLPPPSLSCSFPLSFCLPLCLALSFCLSFYRFFPSMAAYANTGPPFQRAVYP